MAGRVCDLNLKSQETGARRAGIPPGFKMLFARFRWYRSLLAQPPANGLKPSGLGKLYGRAGVRLESQITRDWGEKGWNPAGIQNAFRSVPVVSLAARSTTG